MYGERNYWRDAQRPTRFFCFDSRIVIFIALVLLHFQIWTILLLTVASIIFLWMDSKRINPANVLLHLRTYFEGPVILARPRSELRRAVDYGFETYVSVHDHQQATYSFQDKNSE